MRGGSLLQSATCVVQPSQVTLCSLTISHDGPFKAPNLVRISELLIWWSVLALHFAQYVQLQLLARSQAFDGDIGVMTFLITKIFKTFTRILLHPIVVYLFMLQEPVCFLNSKRSHSLSPGARSSSADSDFVYRPKKGDQRVGK